MLSEVLVNMKSEGKATFKQKKPLTTYCKLCKPVFVLSCSWISLAPKVTRTVFVDVMIYA